MSSAGSIIDMISRDRRARAMRQGTYENRKARMRQMYVDSLRRSDVTLQEEISPEVLTKVRAEIREKMRTERRRGILIFATILLLVAVFTAFLFALVLPRLV